MELTEYRGVQIDFLHPFDLSLILSTCDTDCNIDQSKVMCLLGANVFYLDMSVTHLSILCWLLPRYVILLY